MKEIKKKKKRSKENDEPGTLGCSCKCVPEENYNPGAHSAYDDGDTCSCTGGGPHAVGVAQQLA